MKLLYVVQAYGREVFGGAESHCRMVATRMAARGHEVEVLTSCATSYYDWADVYEPGASDLDGVTVNRLRVSAPRDHETFGPLSGRVLGGYKPVPYFMQQQWLKAQGPDMPELQDWLWDRALDFDAVIFFTYLYSPTYEGLLVTAGRTRTIMHPLTHDEPHIHLPIFTSVFRTPRGILYSTPEEAALARRTFRPNSKQAIIGIGADLDSFGDGERFRQQYNLGDDPYLVCVGRLDPSKGSDELYDQFIAYKQRSPSPLKLVLIGEPVKPVAPHPDVIVTGYVDRQVRDDGVAGATASVHPSYFESFSMALTEAWVQRRPALVNARCDVFAGQAERSGGAIPYERFAEFEAAVDMVVNDDRIARRLGAAGRAYTEANYDWDQLLTRYEEFVQRVPVA
jgi:glycosyltransferase involved in cell wall biosynthesis